MAHFTADQTRHCRGFSLLELTVALALLSGWGFALLYKTTDVSVQVAQQNTESALAAADEQLRQFAAWNGRLPCPDTTGNGIENCSGGAQKGNLPYRTLGLAAVGYTVGEQGSRAMIYGAYRNEVADADLAVTAERFKPTNADETAYDLGNENTLDFCSALEDASELSLDAGYLHVTHANDTKVAMAYMLASPGVADADQNGNRYDGLNATSAPEFNAPNTPVSSGYDDITQGRGLAELYELLHCEASQRSLNLAANAIALEEENYAFAESNKDSAEQGLMMNAVGTALTAWSTGQAAAGLSGAIEVLSISSGLLAGVTATCPVPPFAGCALIPVYTGAVSSANTGIGLSATAVGLSAAALGLQTTSTVLYKLIADKIPDEVGAPDAYEGGSGITEEMVDDAKTDYDQANDDAVDASSAYATAFTDHNSKEEAAEISRQALDDLLTADQQEAAEKYLYTLQNPDNLAEDDERYKDSVILGVEPAIDAWKSAAEAAERMNNVGSIDVNTDIEIVDADGNPVLDADGNPVTIDESTQEALEQAKDELGEAATKAADEAEKAAALAQTRIDDGLGELIELACGSDGSSCDSEQSIKDVFDAHVTAYTAEREAFYELETLEAEAKAADDKVESAGDAYRALDCAFNNNQDYNPETNLCTDGAPGSSAGDVGDDIAICDSSNKDVYDAEACAALEGPETPNPLCDNDENNKYYNEAACAALETETNPSRLTFFQGMNGLVNQLDDKGVVQ